MDDPEADALKSRYLPRMLEELDGLRAASGKTSRDRKPIELDQQSVGRLSRMDAMQQQAMAAAQDARRHGRIRALQAAIRRLDEGAFGWCDRSRPQPAEPRGRDTGTQGPHAGLDAKIQNLRWLKENAE